MTGSGYPMRRVSARGNEMRVGQTLRRQSLTSPSGEYVFVHQDDGNVVLYDDVRNRPLWSTGTEGAPVGVFVLQDDGNLVLYQRDGRAVWSTGTQGRSAERLIVGDDGNVALTDAESRVLWCTDTQQRTLPGSATLPTTEQDWRGFLAEYSADYLRVAEDRDLKKVSRHQRERCWLGFPPATEAEIMELETRLGHGLPPSYRSFLLVSNGWIDPGPFMYRLRPAADVDWLPIAATDLLDALGSAGADDLAGLMERCLLIADDGDAQYWFLDPADVSEDGEWAAYSWSSWGVDEERQASFAALLADERHSFEALRAREGRAVHPEGSAELTAQGRVQALRGDVDGALNSFDQAIHKGSGLAMYLATILNVFLHPDGAHHRMRNDAFGGPVGRGEIDLAHVRAELVPLYLRWSAEDPHAHPAWYLPPLGDALPRTETAFDDGNRDHWLARAAEFIPPVLAETPEFERALSRARELARLHNDDAAWAVIEAALPDWRPDSEFRVAPVILLIDPDLRTAVTPDRYRQIVTTVRTEVD
jgi:hypothetical protein